MLTKNLWVDTGLCNGTMETVEAIIYKSGQKPPLLTIAVIVQFEGKYTGPTFSSEKPRCVSIIPVTNKSDTLGSGYERQRLLLRLARSLTIHKSDGLTLSKACIDLGQSEKAAELTYVALSRVHSLKDIIIEPMTLERIHAVKK